MQTTEKTKSTLALLKKGIPTVDFRESENIIKFNVGSLNGNGMSFLTAVSTVVKCDIEVKRSGTGLAVILKC